MYADVIVPRHIAKAFTYIVPEALAQCVAIGRRVLVPFGRTTLEGAVVSLSEQPPRGLDVAHLREILALADNAGDTEQESAWLKLSRAIADYYVTPWGQCLRLVSPRNPTDRTSTVRFVALDRGLASVDAGTCPEHLRDTLKRTARLSRGSPRATFRPSHGRGERNAVEALERPWIVAEPLPSRKADTFSHSDQASDRGVSDTDQPGATLPAWQPSAADSQWMARVTDCLRANQARKLVLHACWEQRIDRLVGALRLVRAIGKSAIVLSGEVARAQWLGRRLSDLAECPVIVLSSSRSSHRQVQSLPGNPLVVVGTRSAIFCQPGRVGLIWVDGEEDPAFKEPQEPRYHARDVAWIRAQADGAVLVLASAHPSLESVGGTDMEIHTIPTDPASRPAMELIDLNQEARGTLFSSRLVEAMQEAMVAGMGTLLFLNRKGYARTLFCRDCGWMPRCPVCAVTLGYSREAGKLTCRYCGSGDRLPQSCPRCSASVLHPVGDGTERAEAEVRRLFPQARIARLDRDRLRRPSAIRHIWEGIRSGSWDILIGTQALFQREPLPRRGLVGILDADSGLHIPDFRAAERTYQLLDEAVSLARPATEGGRVILQTRFPGHHAVQAVVSNDPRRFYDEELAARRLLNYPPACYLASLSVSGKVQPEVEAAAIEWRNRLEEAIRGENTVTLMGPVSTIGRRPKGLYRCRLLVKAIDRQFLCRCIRDTLDEMERNDRRKRTKFVVDMDPLDLS